MHLVTVISQSCYNLHNKDMGDGRSPTVGTSGGAEYQPSASPRAHPGARQGPPGEPGTRQGGQGGGVQATIHKDPKMKLGTQKSFAWVPAQLYTPPNYILNFGVIHGPLHMQYFKLGNGIVLPKGPILGHRATL